MFEFFFKYPASVFAKGRFVLMGSWPRWALFVGVLAAAVFLGWLLWRKRKQLTPGLRGMRMVCLWALQSALVAVLLFLLWEPAISVEALRPQQNIIAVVVDDSRSMAMHDVGEAREQEAKRVLNSGVLNDLRARFQVRLYRLSNGIQPIQNADRLQPTESSTQIGKGSGNWRMRQRPCLSEKLYC